MWRADTRRAGDIIHGIHHFVRKSEGVRCAVNLNEIIREVLRLLHSDLLGRGTAIETQLAPSLPSVDANAVQLQQVLLISPDEFAGRNAGYTRG